MKVPEFNIQGGSKPTSLNGVTGRPESWILEFLLRLDVGV
jgi:hypothetical protein